MGHRQESPSLVPQRGVCRDRWTGVHPDGPLSLPRTIDGPNLRCAFHAGGCSERTALAGGFHEHHRHPRSMGGPENPDDLLILCPLHHGRAHALARAYVQHGPGVRTVRWFSPAERATARYAVTMWRENGAPRISGWSTPAAVIL